MKARTGWVKKPHHARGFDPLGVQAPCINIYGQLLPGITNVTDRARYYSFYPWLVWAYNQSESKRTHDDFIEWIRRGDCLFTLIAGRHRVALGGEDYLLHDAGLIGVNTLRTVISDLEDRGEIILSDYTTLQDGDPNRYFKNPLGGLGQYYLGTFDALGLMGRQGREVGYTARGEQFAEAFNAVVDRELFTQTIRSNRVTVEILDQLFAFCPCGLLASDRERDLLLDLFFNRSSEHGPDGDIRRDTLRLLLHLISSVEPQQASDGFSFDEGTFRTACYTSTLPFNTPWDLPTELDLARECWAVYQRNELLSFAIQSVFWTLLRTLEEAVLTVHSTEEVAAWFSESDWVSGAVRAIGTGEFSGALKRVKEKLPPLSDHHNPAHEINLGEELRKTVRDQSAMDYSRVLSLAGQLVLSLIARDDSEHDPYDPVGFPEDYFSLYPINLVSLRKHSTTTWSGLSVREWFGRLGVDWGVDAHMKVALRKLRQQSQDTFHVAPTDQGFKVLVLPEPSLTTPRFHTSNQILQDIGGIDRAGDRSWTRITEFGQELIGPAHG